MDIHVVKPNDSIESISKQYGVSVSDIIKSNELPNPYDLVPGETIVIVYPTQIHTVKEGDTLGEIARSYGITMMQLFRNNPYLVDREFIYPGEILVISYKTGRNITTNGFTYPFIPKSMLVKTLPFLTYISIYNYRANDQGELTSYYDDTEVIQTALEYGTIPLLMTTTLSPQGEPNIEVAFNILMNNDFQEHHINDILNTIKEKGFHGVNMVFSYISPSNINLYTIFITKVASRVQKEGYLCFVTINPRGTENDGPLFEEIDYSPISQVADSISFNHFEWGKNTNPPGPIYSYTNLKQFLEYTVKKIPPEKIKIGVPTTGYDWTLPYTPDKSVASAVSLRDAINLAREARSKIMFDEISQTPYFSYKQSYISSEEEHIVWFIDARTFQSLMNLIIEYNLNGKGIWNIMIFYAQMWLVVNSQFNIIKLIPDDFTI
jgi:spore germination protein